jgi:hypothetical protein
VSFAIRLTRQGFRRDVRDPDDAESDREIIPEDVFELLRYWHFTLDGIDDDYTLGDLITLLRGVDGIERLSGLLACDVAAFLAEADKPPTPDRDDRMRFVQVHNVASLTKYQEDPDHPDEPLEWMDEAAAEEQDRLDAGVASLTGERPPWKLVDATGDDPITGEPRLRRLRAPRLHGRWIGPYHISRDFGGWGRWSEPYGGFFAEHPEIDPASYEGGYALDFTPLQDLLHYPLRYDPTVEFWSDYPTGTGEKLLATTLTITFGELVHAIFWEIGFHGTPDARDEAGEMVRERMDDVKREEGE